MEVNTYCKFEIIKVNSDSKNITDRNLNYGDRFIVSGKSDLLFKLNLPLEDDNVICSNEKGDIFRINKMEKVIRLKGLKGTFYGFGQDFKKHFEDSNEIKNLKE